MVVSRSNPSLVKAAVRATPGRRMSEGPGPGLGLGLGRGLGRRLGLGPKRRPGREVGSGEGGGARGPSVPRSRPVGRAGSGTPRPRGHPQSVPCVLRPGDPRVHASCATAEELFGKFSEKKFKKFSKKFSKKIQKENSKKNSKISGMPPPAATWGHMSGGPGVQVVARAPAADAKLRTACVAA